MKKYYLKIGILGIGCFLVVLKKVVVICPLFLLPSRSSGCPIMHLYLRRVGVEPLALHLHPPLLLQLGSIHLLQLPQGKALGQGGERGMKTKCLSPKTVSEEQGGKLSHQERPILSRPCLPTRSAWAESPWT